jgi:hypothetical protein
VEPVIISLVAPNASFLDHLAEMLAGLLHITVLGHSTGDHVCCLRRALLFIVHTSTRYPAGGAFPHSIVLRTQWLGTLCAAQTQGLCGCPCTKQLTHLMRLAGSTSGDGFLDQARWQLQRRVARFWRSFTGLRSRTPVRLPASNLSVGASMAGPGSLCLLSN